ncbi:hypothetical protein [Vitreoscilla stercoraria]|uniref:XRE family transcriptional regulator n=1 Tax=Vitreoscilla stercoraria TaxID=61 RepID=A0ABY4EE92_VITST|nr:hypothetical protein [Vitreoscilla stercoraria]UOO93606.1 XRE family transcriptional regulator [Vitreoscilla stercoraria]
MNEDNQEWLEVLRAEVAKSSIAKVAKKLEYSPAVVSLVLSGKYQGNIDNVIKRVIEMYMIVECPYLEAKMVLNDCRTFALGRAPTHSPPKMQHWRACRRCPLKPKELDS